MQMRSVKVGGQVVKRVDGQNGCHCWAGRNCMSPVIPPVLLYILVNLRGISLFS